MSAEGRVRGDDPSLPPRTLLEIQDRALSAMRSRLLRRLGVAHRGPVLDVGAGHGVSTAELARRSRGPVTVLDRRGDVLRGMSGVTAVQADAAAMPFAGGRFELVLVQCVLMWNGAEARRRIAGEIARVLAPGGAALVIEPDYGAALEHPASIAVAPILASALRRAGADPEVGRKVPSELAAAGLAVRTELSPEVGAADDGRFDLAEGLPLSDGERTRLAAARRADASLAAAQKTAHVPFVFVTAEKAAR